MQMNADLIHETALAYAIAPNDERLETAVKAALPLTQAIAVRFSGRGVELDDLKQVAAMALVEALRRFEPGRGLRFTTFVTPTITGKVRNYIRDKAQILRSPRGLKELGIKMDRANDHLIQRLNREPTVMELAEFLSWPVEQVLDVQTMRDKTTVQSLDMPDEDGLFAFDRVGEEDQGFDAFELHEDLRNAMQHLTKPEKELLNLRYAKRLSQSQVAKQLGMTQMQVSRLERRTLQNLKKTMMAD